MKTKNSNEKSKKLKEQITNNYKKIIGFVIHKMRLDYRKEELFDIGMIGFVRGLNTYDESKGFTYMTYLYDCIQHEIGKHLEYEKREKRKGETISLNTIINENIELQDLIGYEVDYEQNSYINELINLIEKRSIDFTKKQWIIFNHLYGMNGYKELTPREITEKYGFSRQSVYQIKEKVLKMLRHTLNNYRNKEGYYEKRRDNQNLHFTRLR